MANIMSVVGEELVAPQLGHDTCLTAIPLSSDDRCTEWIRVLQETLKRRHFRFPRWSSAFVMRWSSACQVPKKVGSRSGHS
jgi:hypothetical protein